MQRGGKRKSPFVGGSEPLDGGILYGRITDLSSVLLDGEEAAAAPPASEQAPKREKKRDKEEKKKRKAQELAASAEPASAPAAANGAVAAAGEPAPGQKHRKKARWTEEQKAAARAEREAAAVAKKGKGKVAEDAHGPDAAAPAEPAADGDAGGKKKEKRKKAAVPVKLAPEERVSGPGNADEAQRMRQALGFVAAAPAAAPAAGKLAFSFGFGNQGAQAVDASEGKEESSSSDDDSSSSDEEEQAAVAGGSDSGSSSSSSCEEDSSSEEEEDSLEVKRIAEAASSSSEEEEESSSSEEGDSSEEEEDTPAPAPAPAAAAAGSDATSSDTSSSSSSSDSDDEGAGQQQARGDGEYVPRRVYVGGMPYGYTEDQIWEYWGYCGEIESLDMMTFPDTGRFRGIVFITFKTEEAYQAALACNGEQCDGQTLKVMKCRPSAKDRQQMQAAQAAQQGQQGQQARPQFAPPTSYDDGEAAGGSQGTPAWARPQAGSQERQPRQQQQRRQEQGGGQEGGAAPQRSQHSGPAPKTPGYHVAYVGNVAYEADDKALARLFEPCGVVKVRLHTDKDTGKPKGFAHVHFRDEAGLDQAVQLDGTSLLGRRIRVGYAQPKKEQPAQ